MSAGSTVGITTCTAGQSGGFVYQGTTSKQLYVNFIGATTFTTVKATSGNGGVFAILQTSYIANIQATSPVFTGSASGGKGGVFYFKGTDFTFTGTSVTLPSLILNQLEDMEEFLLLKIKQLELQIFL